MNQVDQFQKLASLVSSIQMTTSCDQADAKRIPDQFSNDIQKMDAKMSQPNSFPLYEYQNGPIYRSWLYVTSFSSVSY